jgi:hypothetical protein
MSYNLAKETPAIYLAGRGGEVHIPALEVSGSRVYNDDQGQKDLRSICTAAHSFLLSPMGTSPFALRVILIYI